MLWILSGACRKKQAVLHVTVLLGGLTCVLDSLFTHGPRERERMEGSRVGGRTRGADWTEVAPLVTAEALVVHTRGSRGGLEKGFEGVATY